MMLEQGDECHIVNTASARRTRCAAVARDVLGQQVRRSGDVGIAQRGTPDDRLEDRRLRGLPGGGQHPHRRRGAQPAGGAAERRRRGATAQAQAFGEAFRAMLAHGLPPEQIADAVVDSIKSERLYVMPQVETETRIRARFERMLSDVRAASA